MRTKLQLLELLCFAILFTAGCGNPFLDTAIINKIEQQKTDQTKCLYYQEDHFLLTPEDCRSQIRTVVKAGTNKNALPSLLLVFNNSVTELLTYHARILRQGSVKGSYTRSDLLKFSLSSSNMVSESSLLMLSIADKIEPGDIIETYTEYRHHLPQLGFTSQAPKEMIESGTVQCSYTIPVNRVLQYTLRNVSLTPVQTAKDGLSTYTFQWQSKKELPNTNPFASTNTSPEILTAYPFSATTGNNYSWKEFGDWYIALTSAKLIPTKKIEQLAAEITTGCNADLQKMEAIFNYISKKVRYEQVYASLGEFIPNDCEVILNRGYGDCKDYTTIMYALAKSCNIAVHPALCYRGRRSYEFSNLPVNQFNHMILHLELDGKDYWFDGTNRSTTAGITTSDVINHSALVLKNGGSEIRTIGMHESSAIAVSGTMHGTGRDILGDLRIHISGQYAADFYYAEFIQNTKDYADWLADWLKSNLHPELQAKKIRTEKSNGGYDIFLTAVFPNSITSAGGNNYNALLQTFPQLLPQMPANAKPEELYYYPGYTAVKLDIAFNNAVSGATGDSTNVAYKESWCFSPGPFTEAQRKAFLQDFTSLYKKLSQKQKIQMRDTQ